jgi:hypothetical protein
MRIVSILKEHLDSLINDGLTETLYTYPAQFNNIAGRCGMPVGVLVTPNEWTLEIDTITAREVGFFNIYFLTPQLELDFNAVKNEIEIDKMIDVACKYVALLKHDKRIHLENVEIMGNSLYDVNNKNLTGCRLRIKVKEQQGRCIDNPNPRC